MKDLTQKQTVRVLQKLYPEAFVSTTITMTSYTFDPDFEFQGPNKTKAVYVATYGHSGAHFTFREAVDTMVARIKLTQQTVKPTESPDVQ